MELWIAKDYNKQLWLHTSKPRKEGWVFQSDNCVQISSEAFPNITWENSPKKVELKMK